MLRSVFLDTVYNMRATSTECGCTKTPSIFTTDRCSYKIQGRSMNELQNGTSLFEKYMFGREFYYVEILLMTNSIKAKKKTDK